MGAAAAIYEDCLSLMEDLSRLEVKHCGRESNSVAHELAQLAKHNPISSWFTSPPPSIVPLLLEDVTIVSMK